MKLTPEQLAELIAKIFANINEKRKARKEGSLFLGHPETGKGYGVRVCIHERCRAYDKPGRGEKL